MRLLSAEIRRFLARRAVVLLLLTGFGLSVFVVGAELWSHRPVSAEALQEAEDRAAADAQSPHMQRELERCREHPRQYGGNCQAMVPQAEWYLGENPLEPFQTIKAVSMPISIAVGFMALLAGTSFMGAEFSSGSISNVLLFEPRRWRVWLAKMTAAGLVVAVVATATVVVCYAAVTALGIAWQDASYTADQWWTIAYRGLRSVLMVGASALLGAAITAALRSTIATAGLVLGYLLVGEALLRSVLFEQTARWLASHHVAAFIDGKLKVQTYTDEGPGKVFRFSLHESAVYLGVAMAVVLALSYVVFQRRDVT